MANLFLDYLNGNNANAGTTFALRFKDITSGPTAARIAPGDVVRIMKSPDPTSLGVNGTFTRGSPIITLASALTANITDCASVWTASANVTATTTATCKEGSLAASLSLATAFATGKAAYFATGTLDLSGYQQVSFWVRTSTTNAATNLLSLNLCTDTAGATPVHTIPIPIIAAANTWTRVTYDFATNLNAAIKSVALYQDTDRSAVVVLIDNIIACKASSSADSLSLTSLIGKNTSNETWYSIASINGTTVRLDNGTNALPAAQRGYGGVTETVTAYKRETIKVTPVAATATASQTVQDSGTAGNPITFSGGWDTTDMTTQDGETWFDGQNGMGLGLSSASRSYITLNKIRFVNFGTAGLSISGTSNNHTINDVTCNNNTLDGLVLSATGLNNDYSNLIACNNAQVGLNNSGSGSHTLQSGYVIVDGNTSGADTSGFVILCLTGTTVPFIRSSCNGGSGLTISGATNCTFTSLEANYNSGGSNGMVISVASGATITSAVASNNTNSTAFNIGGSAALAAVTSVTCNSNTSVGLLVNQASLTIDAVTANSNGTGVQIATNNVTITEVVSANSNATGLQLGGSKSYIPTVTEANSNTTTAFTISGHSNRIDTIVACNSNTAIAMSLSGVNNTVGEMTGDANGTGVSFTGRNNTVESLILTNTVTTGIAWSTGVDNRVLAGSQAGGTQGMTVTTGTGLLNNFTISNATEISTGGTPFSDYRVASVNHDNTADNHQVFCDGGLISSEATTRHTASGLAWRMRPTSANRSATYPLKLPLGLYALDAGTVTIKCWLRRSNTGLTMKLVAPLNSAVGIDAEVSSSMTAAADTWEEVTISVSPDANGVIELEVQAYGGTTYSGYVDDLTVNGVAVPLDYAWDGQPFCSPLVTAGGATRNLGIRSGGSVF